jgi:small conductance mechanosensitive channel
VAGVSITIYRPFRLGDTLQVAAPTGTEVGVVELISLGYTTLRAPAGHLIVVPNSVAASQVTINLNTNASFAPWPLVITIRIGRGADIEAARELALVVAKENADAKAAAGCFLTKVDATSVTLELRLRADDSAHRDKLRSTLLGELARRFAAAHLGAIGDEAPTFA